MKRFLLSLAALAAAAGCVLEEDPPGPLFRRGAEASLKVSGISKWYRGYQSAYTPTYDVATVDGSEIEWVRQQGLFVDFEVITDLYEQHPDRMELLRDRMVPAGFGYFGHGHTHIDHDQLDSAAAYASFRKNFEGMVAGGLKPVSYAYPGGYGYEAETHGALRAAGFLSGRLAKQWSDTEPWLPPYIMPGAESEPRNWFMLPALYMQDSAFAGCAACVNNPKEFAAHLDKSIENGAWLISVYHAIGWDGKGGRVVGWGFYDLENFKTEMLLVKSLRDRGILWLANMDAVTLYARERKATTWKVTRTGSGTFDLRLTNKLDKARFDHPLTLRLSLDGALGRRLRITPSNSKVAVVDTLVVNEQMLVDLVPADRPYKVEVL